MSSDLLATLDALAAKATARPWRIHEPRPDTIYAPQLLTEDGGILAEMTSYGKMRADARFLLALVNAWPAISAELRAARAVCETIRTFRESYARPEDTNVWGAIDAWRRARSGSETP